MVLLTNTCNKFYATTWNWFRETAASPPCFFPTRRERTVYMLEGCTIYTWKICTLGIFHAIFRNLGLYMTAGKAKIRNRVDSPRCEAMGWVRPYLGAGQKWEKTAHKQTAITRVNIYCCLTEGLYRPITKDTYSNFEKWWDAGRVPGGRALPKNM